MEIVLLNLIKEYELIYLAVYIGGVFFLLFLAGYAINETIKEIKKGD